MKELGITKGLWVAIEYAGHYDLQLAPFYEEPSILDEENVGTEAYSNAFLCVDAGNTAQKCGLLPSELLQQRDEMKEALISMMWQFAYYGTKNNVAVMHTGGLSALEDAFVALGLSDPITVADFEAAIKNTDTK